MAKMPKLFIRYVRFRVFFRWKPVFYQKRCVYIVITPCIHHSNRRIVRFSLGIFKRDKKNFVNDWLAHRDSVYISAIHIYCKHVSNCSEVSFGREKIIPEGRRGTASNSDCKCDSSHFWRSLPTCVRRHRLLTSFVRKRVSAPP